MPFPDIDPIALHLGPLVIRWYALAYIAGILLSLAYIRSMNRRLPLPNLTPEALWDGCGYAAAGIILGGRLGYVLFYKPGYYLEHPLQMFFLWEGGMSFHGGMVGVIVAFILFCRRFGVPLWPFLDMLAAAAPMGLLLGRLANFVNGELFGRVTDMPWGMVFPRGGPLPRHPSQLYEASLEGVLLFIILFILQRFTPARRHAGALSGVFLIGYALSRMTAELFREPDTQLGFLFGIITMGQLLCLPMLAFGAWLVRRAFRRGRVQTRTSAVEARSRSGA